MYQIELDNRNHCGSSSAIYQTQYTTSYKNNPMKYRFETLKIHLYNYTMTIRFPILPTNVEELL